MFILKNKFVFITSLALVLGLSALTVSAVSISVAGSEGNYQVVVDWEDGVNSSASNSFSNPPENVGSTPVDADNVIVNFAVDGTDIYTGSARRGVANFTTTLVVVDTTAPVITLLGDAVMNIDRNSVFTDPGATAIDDIDGSVTVVPSGSVDTTTVGAYTITYNVSDFAGNSATPVTRTVNVSAPIPTPTPVITSTGSSGGTGYAPGFGPSLGGLGGIISGQVLGATTFRFTKVLRLGAKGNDVKELQERLRAEGFFTYKTSTGYFGSITKTALKAYQKSHKLIPYGILNKATIAFING